MIPLSVPEINGNEWKYIKECLDTGWVSSVGSFVNDFEAKVSKYLGIDHAIALSSGTAALHLSLLVSGVESDDEVIVPTLSFIAPINAVKYCQAHPVFMDCDRNTLCLDVEKLTQFLSAECDMKADGNTYNKKTGRRIRAIIPVHIFGHPVDMDPLLACAKKYNLTVIEDAAESIGSEYKDKKTGSIGHLGCLSFNGNKIITTGGGGMVLTQDRVMAEKIRHLSTQAKTHPVEYDHDAVGYNYRLTNIQAALGVAQMENLEQYLEIKRSNALKYKEQLDEIDGIEFLWERSGVKSNFWFYTLRVAKDQKQALLEHLLSKEIQARPVWKLNHTLKMYNGYEAYRIENAQEVYDTCLNIPCSVGLKEEELNKVVNTVKEHFSVTTG